MTTKQAESDKAGQGRAITRGEEARALAVISRALQIQPEGLDLQWWTDGRLCSIEGLSWPARADGETVAALARAGIVPGAEGWCWAPAPAVAAETPQSAPMGAQVATAAAVTAPTPTRAEQVRAALLAVLSRGPVGGVANVLAALDGEGVRPAADGVEARQAAAEIGATIGGARWALPALPHGYAWRGSLPSYLCRVDAVEPVREAVASVAPSGTAYRVWSADGREIEQGECDDETDGQRKAVATARRAGLFARPSQPEAPVAPAPHVEPATGPLDALLALLSHVARGPLDHETQRAASVFVGAVVAVLARAYADDARNASALKAAEGERDHEREGRESAERQFADTQRERAAALRERDAARAELAALQRGLDGLRTWAEGAKGGGK